MNCFIIVVCIFFCKKRDNTKALPNFPVVESYLSSIHIRHHSLPRRNMIHFLFILFLIPEFWLCNILWPHMCTVIINVRRRLQLFSTPSLMLFVFTGERLRDSALLSCNAAFEHTEVLHHHSPLINVIMVLSCTADNV